MALACRWWSRPQHHFRTHALQQWAATFVISSASVGAKIKPSLSMWLRTTNGGVSRRQKCCTRSIATKVDESRPARHYAAGMMFWLTRNALAESYLLFTAAGRARLSPTTRSSALPKRIVSHPSWWAPRQVQVPGLVQIAGFGERGRARQEGRLEVGFGEIGAGEIGVGEVGSCKVAVVEVAVRQIGVLQLREFEIGAREIGAAQIRIPEIGGLEHAAHQAHRLVSHVRAEIGAGKLGSDQAGTGKISGYSRAAQIGTAKLGALHLRAEQRCLDEGRLRQIRVDQPGLVQDGPIEARAFQIRPVELCQAKISAGEVEAREIEVR